MGGYQSPAVTAVTCAPAHAIGYAEGRGIGHCRFAGIQTS
jgi:hypothetical protein